MSKLTFSGHESFFCRSLWLKKGFDALESGVDFNAPDAVVKLGVGKNMVSAIRYWMKAFGLMEDNQATRIASFIFSNDGGVDPFLEDNGSLWILHYQIITKQIASLYNLAFLELRRDHRSVRIRSRKTSPSSSGTTSLRPIRKALKIFPHC